MRHRKRGYNRAKSLGIGPATGPYAVMHARVVGDVLMATFRTGRHVPAKRGGPAIFDRGHHPQLR